MHELTQPFGQVRIDLSHWSRRLLTHLFHHGQHIVRTKRAEAGTHRVHHASKAEQVAPLVDDFTASLLGRHTLWRAQNLAGMSDPAVRYCSCQAEVGDLDSFDAVLQQNIGRLDVAMNQSTLVSRCEPFRDLPGDANDLFHLQRADSLDLVMQSLADNTFHHQKW